LKGFRLISLLEGISYLLILSVTLGVISRDYVSYLGMVHGVLFIAYLTFSIHVSHQQKWSIITLLLLFLAAIIPFAFFFVELFIRKQLNEKQESSMV